MRGEDRTSGALFSYVDVEARIPAKHPPRAMRVLTDAALAKLDRAFAGLYERIGRPSVPPERLLRASLLQLLYSIRLERQLVERLEFDMLFAGSSGLRSTRKCSTPRASPRTATACSYQFYLSATHRAQIELVLFRRASDGDGRMTVATRFCCSSGRATPSLRRSKIAKPRAQPNPAGIHSISAGRCPDKPSQLS